MRKVLCEWNQEEIDELATETCECVNARIYTHKKSQKNGIKGKISITTKGIVKVTRTKTNTSTYEA